MRPHQRHDHLAHHIPLRHRQPQEQLEDFPFLITHARPPAPAAFADRLRHLVAIAQDLCLPLATRANILVVGGHRLAAQPQARHMQGDQLAPITLIEFPLDDGGLGRHARAFKSNQQARRKFGLDLIHAGNLRSQLNNPLSTQITYTIFMTFA